MKKIISLISASLLLLASISTGVILSVKEDVYTPTFATYTNGDADTYYNGISGDGTSLLQSLQSLNSAKRKSLVGYDNMGTSPKGQFKYTDYDPNNYKLDSNNQPYGTTLIPFYNGKPATSGMNREHVWPDSRGGNTVEADIHMPRPTLSADNSSRGNSFYVKNMTSSQNGWDPGAVDGQDPTYRGDSARIIFYCAIANKELTLVDKTNDSASNKTMGKLSDLIEWHLTYPVLQREMNRNEGAEYLQGNRNPFIDHPEYVCRIWGNTNDETRKLCANDPYSKLAPTAISLDKTTAIMKVYETLQLKVTSITPSDADGSVTWSSSNENIASVNSSGVVSAKNTGNVSIIATSIKDNNVKATCAITIQEPDAVVLTDFTVTDLSLTINETKLINIVTSPTNAYPVPTFSFVSNDTSIASVNGDGVVKGIKEGSASINVTATQNDISIVKNITVTVNEQTTPLYSLVTDNSQLANNDKVVVTTGLEENSIGVSGFDGNKNATVSELEEEWKQYVVKNSSSSGFNLYDEDSEQYIASPTSNEFKYSDNPGLCSVDKDGHLVCNSRWLQVNSNQYFRFYSSLNNDYIPFFVYKIGQAIPDNPDTPIEPNDPIIPDDPENPDTPENPDNPNEGDNSGDNTQPEIINPTSIALDVQSGTIVVGESLQLNATVLPENATYAGYNWYSSDDNIATVSNSGLVTAISPGIAIITVTLNESNLSSTCILTIKEKANTPTNNPVKSGCGGEIVATSVILSSLSLTCLALLLLKKKREK